MNQLVGTNQTEWKPLAEDAIKTDGLFVKQAAGLEVDPNIKKCHSIKS